MQRLDQNLLFFVAAIAFFAMVGTANAGDYTYAMAANDAVYGSSGAGINESAGGSSGSSGGRIENMSSRYLVSGDDAGASVPSAGGDLDIPSAAAPAIGGGSAGSERRVPTTHRWQSLVPGAIK